MYELDESRNKYGILVGKLYLQWPLGKEVGFEN